jgi:hypothetical protein
MQISSKIFSIALIFAIFGGSCKKETTNTTLQNLYQTYKEGAIDDCAYNGKTVYHTSRNVYDASEEIYDEYGKHLATCNYAWGGVDSLCYKITNCTTIYRCHNSITGQPFVDKYGLSK